MIEASATFSAFDGSLRSLLDFLFSVKQCVPTAAVSLSTLAYELAQELAVSRLCTVLVAYMVYLARLRSALRCWLACIGCSVQPISERLAKMANGRTIKWRDVTISLTACQHVTPIVQYCHLL